MTRAGAADRSPGAPTSSSTRSTTPATSRPGASRPRGVRGSAGGCRSRARRSGPTPAPSRSCATRRTRRSRTSSTATAMRCATGAWCGRSTSRGWAARWSGARRTAPCTRRPSTTRWRPSSPTSGCGPPSRSTASGCPRSCATPSTGSPRCAATRRTPAAWSSPSTRTTPRDRRRCCARAFGATAVVVTSDDPAASADRGVRDRPRRVAGGGAHGHRGRGHPAAARGRLRDQTTTDLFFRQAVGRFVRWVPGVRDQRAWLYLPDDPRLRIRAAQIAEQRRHSLRKKRPRDDDDGAAAGPRRPAMRGEQLSMFEALSAVATGEAGAIAPWHEALPDDWSDAPTASIDWTSPLRRRSPRRRTDVPGLTRRQIEGPPAGRERRGGPGHRLRDGPDVRRGEPGAEPPGRDPPRDRGHRGEAPGPRLGAARRWQWRLGR